MLLVKSKTILKLFFVETKRKLTAIIDFAYLFLLNFDFKNNSKSRHKKITFVTAADQKYYLKANRLIKSINKTNPDSNIFFYNLDSKNEFNFENLKNVKYYDFEFDKYPNFLKESHFSKYDNDNKLGSYAWKAVIISEVANKSNGILLWLDAASIVTKNLNQLKKVIVKRSFYSPISSNKIKDWTHFSLIKKLHLSETFINKKNLSSGCVGFDLENKINSEIIIKWKLMSLDEDFIKPKGSSRLNHRQDQALLTIIYHQAYIKKLFPKTHKIFGIKLQVKL